MTETVVAETVTETPSYLDSEGAKVQAGNWVRIQINIAEPGHEYLREEGVEYRPFDIGLVDALNPDGTVEVYWDQADCVCTSSRTENTSDLTVTTDNEYSAFYTGKHLGMQEGLKEAQRRFRAAIGLDSDTE